VRSNVRILFYDDWLQVIKIAMHDRFVEKNGRNWRVLAKELGKNEIHVKDTWRRIKPKNLKRGVFHCIAFKFITS